MKIANVQQGSVEWLELRATKFTASEAPSMMGYGWISRDELLKQKATGITPEVLPDLQEIFDKGHAAEESARPLIEEKIGEELYPATAVSDEYDWLLASFDGVTMLEDIVFEHMNCRQNTTGSLNSCFWYQGPKKPFSWFQTARKKTW